MRRVALLISIFLYTFLFAAEFEITSKIKENPGHMGLQMLDDSQKYDINDELCTLLIVRCGIKHINFSNTASKEGQIDKAGEYWIPLKQNANYIVLKKEGFGNFKENFGFKLKSGSVYEMSVDAKNIQATQIPIMITCDPSGTEVLIDDISQGTISRGKLSFNAIEGKHKLTLKMDGFETIYEKIDIKIGSQGFDYKLLEAMDAVVSIQTSPSGANVWIKDIKMGKSPVNNFFPTGEYKVRIEKENYETIEEKIIISDSTDITYKLIDIRAKLTVKTHPNAIVYINNDNGHKGGVKDMLLTPQVVDIRVEMAKAEIITKSVLLDKKADITKEFYLDVKTGTVIVNVIPTNAQIELKGDLGEYYKSKGKKIYHDIPVGEYRLYIKAKYHKSKVFSLSLQENEVITKKIILENGSYLSDSMVFIEGGTFLMGSENGSHDEKPLHSVTVSDYYIGMYEVTQEDWIALNGSNHSYNKGLDLPVETISWYDAIDFCNKKSEMFGLDRCYSKNGEYIHCDFTKNGFRLPTEAEWEYAARGGELSRSFNYSGSRNVDTVAVYDENSMSSETVGSMQPNELGLFDMSGNVWEFCWDFYSDYSSNSQINPTGPPSGYHIVIRGGSWSRSSSRCQVAIRDFNPQEGRLNNLGFRIVRSSINIQKDI